MTDFLYKMLKNKYPESWNSISIYGAHERVYILLNDLSFLNQREDLITLPEIEKICEKHFEGFYELKFGREISSEDNGLYVFFNHLSETNFKEYDGHLIKLDHFHIPLYLEIWTGNRGGVGLKPKQRENYFDFVEDIFETFKKNARLKD